MFPSQSPPILIRSLLNIFSFQTSISLSLNISLPQCPFFSVFFPISVLSSQYSMFSPFHVLSSQNSISLPLHLSLNFFNSQCPSFSISSFLNVLSFQYISLFVSPSQYPLNVLSMFSQCPSLLISSSLLSSTTNVLCIRYLPLFFQCSSISIYNPFNVVSSQFLRFFSFQYSLLSGSQYIPFSISSLLNILSFQYPPSLMSPSLDFLPSQYLSLLMFFFFLISPLLNSFCSSCLIFLLF